MSFFSVRWKLGLAFVTLGIGLVGSYVMFSKKTFESDKISYIPEGPQNQLQMASQAHQSLEDAEIIKTTPPPLDPPVFVGKEWAFELIEPGASQGPAARGFQKIERPRLQWKASAMAEELASFG